MAPSSRRQTNAATMAVTAATAAHNLTAALALCAVRKPAAGQSVRMMRVRAAGRRTRSGGRPDVSAVHLAHSAGRAR